MLGREINEKVFGTDEFIAKARVEPFLAGMLAKAKLLLIGSAHGLEELAGH